MNTVSVNLRYRPIRFGWCVKTGDFEAIRRAVKLSFMMWGGRFNPIIPVDDHRLADSLIRLFRVDALYLVSDHPDVHKFIEGYPYLPWPFLQDGLIVRRFRQVQPAVVDLSNPIEILYEEQYRNNSNPSSGVDLHYWDSEDPLSDVLMLSYGELPNPEDVGPDYGSLIRLKLSGKDVKIPNGGILPPVYPNRLSVAALNKAYVETHYAVRNHWNYPGVYVGQANCFEDLVAFWNLRATDTPLQFYDLRYPDRFDLWDSFRRNHLAETYGDDQTLQNGTLWLRSGTEIPKHALFEGFGSRCELSDSVSWNGLNVRAPIMTFGNGTTLASIDDSGERPRISFSLVGQPFPDNVDNYRKHYMLSVNTLIGLFNKEQVTLHTPFVPEINEFYGRNSYFKWNAARAEPDSLGIVTTPTTAHLSLNSLNVVSLVSEIFGTVGIEATPSKAGLVATSLIRQMGGLDGCRPFKISGVRSLIESFRPDQSFSRACAKQTILGRNTDKPLSNYKWLYIEPRPSGAELSSDAVLSYLLDRGVFRAGLKFTCPSCQLDFWISLDDAKSRIECEFCGHSFNSSRQLRDKDWAFRRSGLFGRADNQEGAIPVLLTLQQLKQAERLDPAIYTTAMELKPKGAKIHRCETDFVMLDQDAQGGRIQLAIGECKTRKKITPEDVRNLMAVANAFPSDRYDVFIVFSKLADFEEDEIAHIKTVNDQFRKRAIILTERELEPYFIYERIEKEFDIEGIAVSFDDMATITDRVFFQKIRRKR